MTSDTKIRWRMTLDELCFQCKCTVRDIDRWAELGALGPRLREPRDRGWHRHITRVVAGRAVLMSRLVQAGIREDTAARIAVVHEHRQTQDIIVHQNGVNISVSRSNLP